MRKACCLTAAILFIAGCSSPSHETPSPSPKLLDAPTIANPDCAAREYVTLCISEASFDGSGTRILVEAELMDDRLRLAWPFAPLDYQSPQDPAIFLADKNGTRLKLVPDLALPEVADLAVDGDWTEQLFEFPPVAPNTAPFTLHIPSVAILAPLDSSIELDLGNQPGPGSSYTLDAPITVLGHTVVFDHAEIDSQLQLHLYTAPIDLCEGLILRWLQAGMPEGWSSATGPGNKYDFETRRQHLWFPIEKSDGRFNAGAISIPIYTGVLYLSGPFDMSLESP